MIYQEYQLKEGLVATCNKPIIYILNVFHGILFIWCAKPWRVALTRLRIGVHNLQVNLGRHHNPVIPLNNRICLYCLIKKGEEY